MSASHAPTRAGLELLQIQVLQPAVPINGISSHLLPVRTGGDYLSRMSPRSNGERKQYLEGPHTVPLGRHRENVHRAIQNLTTQLFDPIDAGVDAVDGHVDQPR